MKKDYEAINDVQVEDKKKQLERKIRDNR